MAFASFSGLYPMATRAKKGDSRQCAFQFQHAHEHVRCKIRSSSPDFRLRRWLHTARAPPSNKQTEHPTSLFSIQRCLSLLHRLSFVCNRAAAKTNRDSEFPQQTTARTSPLRALSTTVNAAPKKTQTARTFAVLLLLLCLLLLRRERGCVAAVQ